MSIHRRAAKRDESEPEIVETFLAAGASVVKHSGPDEADLVVGYRGRNRLVECKTANAQPTPGQRAWMLSWQGDRVEICRNAAQARKLLRMWDLEAEGPADMLEDMAMGVRR